MEGKIVIGSSLPWIAIVIGALSGWVATNTVNGLAIGALCGIVISLAIYIGLIPILGIFLYDWIAKALFSWVGIDLPILYWFGLIFAVVLTGVIIVLIIIFINDR